MADEEGSESSPVPTALVLLARVLSQGPRPGPRPSPRQPAKPLCAVSARRTGPEIRPPIPQIGRWSARSAPAAPPASQSDPRLCERFWRAVEFYCAYPAVPCRAGEPCVAARSRLSDQDIVGTPPPRRADRETRPGPEAIGDQGGTSGGLNRNPAESGLAVNIKKETCWKFESFSWYTGHLFNTVGLRSENL